MSRQRHEGPLLVQRPFYPEQGVCHVYVVHPPGGVVGGDELRVEVRVRPVAAGLITTPAATKLYRSASATSLIDQHLVIDPGARLEWLPAETIAFDGARARVTTRVDLEGDAAFFGWEMLCLGRPAAGERFESGAVRLGIELSRDGRPLLRERTRVDRESGTLDGTWGLRGHPVLATLVATGARAQDLSLARAVSPPEGLLASTLIGDVLVSRYVGDQAEVARATLGRLWESLRPSLFGTAAVPPRVWAT